MEEALTPERVALVKTAVALATTALLVLGIVLRRAGRAGLLRGPRDAALLALGLLGLLGWWNYGRFGYPARVHLHDGYHHYLGAKYLDELGYEGLYRCTVVADVEAGFGEGLEGRRVRDLATNRIVRGSEVAAEAARCRERFTPERWRAFAGDVAWFRGRMPPEEWRLLQMDHGFNASPVWTLLARALTNRPGGSAADLPWLAAIDPALLLAMWACVLWAFGPRVASVAAVFWGTNAFAEFEWIGGSLLRQDWLVATVIAICLLRRRHAVASGAFLSLATLVRLFPGLVAGAVAARALLVAARRRPPRLAPAHVRFAAGALLGLAVLVVPTLLRSGGASEWAGFAANSVKHLETPLLNQMGLRTVIAYDPAARAERLENLAAADPYEIWKREQQRHFAARRWIFLAALTAYLALLGRALLRSEDWEAAALGTGAIPMAAQLTCYYHAVLVGLALLVARSEAAGALVCALAFASRIVAATVGGLDVPYVWMSVAEVATVVAVTALFAATPREAGEALRDAAHAGPLPPAREP